VGCGSYQLDSSRVGLVVGLGSLGRYESGGGTRTERERERGKEERGKRKGEERRRRKRVKKVEREER